MFRMTTYLLMLSAMIFTSAMLIANPSEVVVKGGGTYLTVSSVNTSFGMNVTRFNIRARKNRIHNGKFHVSSNEAAPVDPVNGIDFEADGVIDAVRVFADHPDIVWCHGFITNGFIKFGTNPSLGEFAGQTIQINNALGEFIGAVTTWGRTNFLTVLENGGQPLPNFFTSSEQNLIKLVQGFSRVLLTNGAKPGVVRIKTSGGDITIP